MARHRPIFNRGRSRTDRDGILDLSPSIAMEARLFRSTDRALRSKMAKQLFLKHPAGLNEQTAIDRLVGHLITLAFRMGSVKPAGYLLGRPI